MPAASRPGSPAGSLRGVPGGVGRFGGALGVGRMPGYVFLMSPWDQSGPQSKGGFLFYSKDMDLFLGGLL